jgi:hypothetical protein
MVGNTGVTYCPRDPGHLEQDDTLFILEGVLTFQARQELLDPGPGSPA